MPDGIAEGQTRRARHLALLALCMALSACSSSGENTMTFFAAPGAYEYHNCDQLAAARIKVVTSQQDLKALIDKAERSTGGAFVGAIAYRSDYMAVTENLRVLDATARDKNCLTPETWRSNTVIR